MDEEQLADGRLEELEESGGRWRLRFTRRLPHPPEKVWRALTEPEHLSAWFPTDIHGERASGAILRFEDGTARWPADRSPRQCDHPGRRGRRHADDRAAVARIGSRRWSADLREIGTRPPRNAEQVRGEPAGAGLRAEEPLAAVVSEEQLAVEQLRMGGQELVEGGVAS
jgi:Activator of Hsp90 ATPase homolog 1-like protein